MDIYTNPLLLQNTLLNLDYDSIINWCRTYTQAQWICRDRLFWQQKAMKDFGTTQQLFDNTTLTPAQRYLEILTQNNGVAFGAERFISLNKVVERAIKKGRDDIYLYAVSLGFNGWLLALRKYAQYGNEAMVNQLLRQIYDDIKYVHAAGGALKGGNLGLFQKMISQAIGLDEGEWKILLSHVAYTGNIELFDYVKSISSTGQYLPWYILEGPVKKGNIQMYNYLFTKIQALSAYNYARLFQIALKNGQRAMFDHLYKIIQTTNFRIDWNTLSFYAAQSANSKFLTYFMSLAPQGYIWNWNSIAGGAAAFSNKDFLDNILSISTPPIDFSEVIKGAIKNNQHYIFDYILTLFIPTDVQWTSMLSYAAAFSSMKMLKYIIIKKPTNVNVNWQRILVASAHYDNLYSFKIIMEHVPSDYDMNWDIIALESVRFGSKRILKYIANLYLPNLHWGNAALEAIRRFRDDEMFLYLMQLTPNQYYNWNDLLFIAEHHQNQSVVQYIHQRIASMSPQPIFNLFSNEDIIEESFPV